MTRREFLKGAGAFVLLCAAGWKALPKLEQALAPTAQTAVGPLLVPGLDILPTGEGGTVSYGGEPLFTVNGTGLALLRCADGARSLDAVIKEAGVAEAASDAAMFFVTLGKAGYLQNRVEVSLYEVRA